MKRILLIEDNLDLRETTGEILELAGYEVETAENGKVGVQMAQEKEFDLIVCDIMMPELDGYGVLHILSRNPDTASIPFIFLTAKTERSDFRKGMSLGADDYLTKPFEETELLDAIEGRLKRNEVFKVDGNEKNNLGDFLDKASTLEDLKNLSENCKTVKFRKKESIYQEGDYARYLYYVNSGKVKLYSVNEDGKEFITELHSESDFFGYISLLQETDRMEYAMAMEATELRLIPKDEFLNLLYTNRDVSARFIKMLSHNLREKEEELIDLAYNTVRKRVADALLLLRDKYKRHGEASFTISISRNDLAGMVGTAPESVIRFLSEFKKDGLVSVSGSQVELLDEKGLENIRY